MHFKNPLKKAADENAAAFKDELKAATALADPEAQRAALETLKEKIGAKGLEDSPRVKLLGSAGMGLTIGLVAGDIAGWVLSAAAVAMTGFAALPLVSAIVGGLTFIGGVCGLAVTTRGNIADTRDKYKTFRAAQQIYKIGKQAGKKLSALNKGAAKQAFTSATNDNADAGQTVQRAPKAETPKPV